MSNEPISLQPLADAHERYHAEEDAAEAADREAARRVGGARIIEGTLIQGTMLLRDLVPVFLKELLRVDVAARGDEDIACVRERVERDEDEYWEMVRNEDVMWDMEELIERLNAAGHPVGFWFGVTEGDGADWGWWKLEAEWLNRVLVAEVTHRPEDYMGELLRAAATVLGREGANVDWESGVGLRLRMDLKSLMEAEAPEGWRWGLETGESREGLGYWPVWEWGERGE